MYCTFIKTSVTFRCLDKNCNLKQRNQIVTYLPINQQCLLRGSLSYLYLNEIHYTISAYNIYLGMITCLYIIKL